MNVYAVVTAKPRGKPTKRLVDCTAKARTTYINMMVDNVCMYVSNNPNLVDSRIKK